MNLFGLVLLFAAYAINRFIMTEATKKLSDSDKLRIFEVFSRKNNYGTIFILILVVVYFASLQYFPGFAERTTIVYVGVFFAYLLFRFATNYRKLKRMEMPSAYIKSFILSYCIFILGFLGMIFCLFWK